MILKVWVVIGAVESNLGVTVKLPASWAFGLLWYGTHTHIGYPPSAEELNDGPVYG